MGQSKPENKEAETYTKGALAPGASVVCQIKPEG